MVGRQRVKEQATFTAAYNDGDTEELTLPDESVRFLPEGCGTGDEAPPLTKEEEKRAYRCQAALADELETMCKARRGQEDPGQAHYKVRGHGRARARTGRQRWVVRSKTFVLWTRGFWQHGLKAVNFRKASG